MAAISLGELPSKHSRGFPNGATHPDKIGIPLGRKAQEEVSGGTETSKYPEEKKTDSLSSGERKGKSPNPCELNGLGSYAIRVL